MKRKKKENKLVCVSGTNFLKRKKKKNKEAFLRFNALSDMIAGSDKRLGDRKEVSRLLDPRYWKWTNRKLLRVIKQDVRAFLAEMNVAAKENKKSGGPEPKAGELSGPPAPVKGPGGADGPACAGDGAVKGFAG